MKSINHLYIVLFLTTTLWALGEKPATMVENALDTLSRVQYHGLTVTVTNNGVLNNKDDLREIVANCRHPEFPVNIVFLKTPSEDMTLAIRTLHGSKIQAWYVVTQSAQLAIVAEKFQDSELDGILLTSDEDLPGIIRELENTKIMLAQRKSSLRLGCQIAPVESDDMYQIFNTINLVLLTTPVTDPLAIAKDVGPILDYAYEIKTPAYVVLGNTTLLQQSTLPQLNKYVSFLNSVLDTKKYKGIVLTAEELDTIRSNKTGR